MILAMEGCLLFLLLALSISSTRCSGVSSEAGNPNVAYCWRMKSSGLISRCLQKRRENIYINCPEDNVIYQPRVFFGVGNHTCTYHAGDCIGQSLAMMKQTNKCHWRKSCSVGWRNGEMILKTDLPNCMGQIATYVAYSHPTCVNKDHVYSMCDVIETDINVTQGVIRSHDAYPWSYDSVKKRCVKTIHVPRYSKLKLNIDDVEIQNEDFLTIYHVTNHSKRVLFNATSAAKETLTVYDGRVDLEFLTAAGDQFGRGFVIKFTIDAVKPAPRTVPESYGYGIPYVENGMASIEECINSKEDTVHLSCPVNHYVYQPHILVGSNNNKKCYHSAGDCTGMIHTLLAQRNDCYWSRSCRLSWHHNVPITKTQSMACFAVLPSYVTLKGFQCIRKDRVFDICDKENWEINQTTGLIRSHSAYPWNYTPGKITCRKRLHVNKKFGLRMITDDFDLDHDSRKERVNIWHVRSDGVRVKKHKLRGNDMTEIIVQDGCLDIEFKIGKSSKTGRGFVIRFEGVLNDNNADNAIFGHDVDECGGKQSFFPKNTTKKHNKKLRKKIKGNKVDRKKSTRLSKRRRRRRRQHKGLRRKLQRLMQ